METNDFCHLADAIDRIFSERRSIRRYLDTAVPQDQLEKIFSLAQRTPSNCNTQPWAVHIASGDTLEKLREALPQRAMSGPMDMDFHYSPKYTGVYQERQFGAANDLYGALGIQREDKEKRQQAFIDNFRFFGAPHVAFLFIPDHFGIREAADIGMYAQSLMLILAAHGLGSCPQTSLGFYADTVKSMLGVEGNQKLLFGLSFGYPNREEAVNHICTNRAALQDVAVFHS